MTEAAPNHILRKKTHMFTVKGKPKFVFIGGPFDGQIRMKEVDSNAEDTSGMELIPGFEGDAPDTSHGCYSRVEGSDNEYLWHDRSYSKKEDAHAHV